MPSDIADTLFESYRPQPYCLKTNQPVQPRHHCSSDTFFVPNVYSPSVKLVGGEEEDMCLRARIPLSSRMPIAQGIRDGKMMYEYAAEVSYTLGDLHDLKSWEGSDKHFPQNFRGRIAERFLSLLLESFVYELAQQARSLNYRDAEGRVVREIRGNDEDRRPQPRGHILDHTAKVVARFNRRTTLDILMKTPEGSRHLLYLPGEVHVESTEIDGLGYLHLFGRKNEMGNYVVIGEIKSGETSQAWRMMDPHQWGASPRMSLEDRLFAPLREIFPHAQFVYVMAGYGSSFFYKRRDDKKVLRRSLHNLVKNLHSSKVIPVFAVVPNFIVWTDISMKFLRHLRTYRMIKFDEAKSAYPYLDWGRLISGDDPPSRTNSSS